MAYLSAWYVTPLSVTLMLLPELMAATKARSSIAVPDELELLDEELELLDEDELLEDEELLDEEELLELCEGASPPQPIKAMAAPTKNDQQRSELRSIVRITAFPGCMPKRRVDKG